MVSFVLLDVTCAPVGPSCSWIWNLYYLIEGLFNTRKGIRYGRYVASCVLSLELDGTIDGNEEWARGWGAHLPVCFQLSIDVFQFTHSLGQLGSLREGARQLECLQASEISSSDDCYLWFHLCHCQTNRQLPHCGWSRMHRCKKIMWDEDAIFDKLEDQGGRSRLRLETGSCTSEEGLRSGLTLLCCLKSLTISKWLLPAIAGRGHPFMCTICLSVQHNDWVSAQLQYGRERNAYNFYGFSVI